MSYRKLKNYAVSRIINLQKKARMKIKCHEEKVLAFTSKFDDIFDIAPENTLSRMTNQEEGEFLTM